MFTTVLSTPVHTRIAEAFHGVRPEDKREELPPCKSDCPDCSEQYRILYQLFKDPWRYRTELSDHQAIAIAAGFNQSLHTDLDHLRTRISSHGDAIAGRWKKKSREKRQALLLQADAEKTLFPGRWDVMRFDCLSDQIQDMEKAIYPNRKKFLVPYLSLDVLVTNPAVFLNLLYNRIRFSPEDWAPYDCEQHAQYWGAGFLQIDYLGLVIIIHGRKYGTLTKWNSEAVYRLDCIGYPRGVLILEAQAQIIILLRNLVDLVLEGVDTNKPGSCTKWHEHASLGFGQSIGAELWSPYVNQPFAAPPRFEIDRFVQSARARLQAAEDHLWLMQTDPSYMHHFIKLSTMGDLHATISSDKFCSCVTTEIMWDVRNLCMWRWVVNESEKMRVLYNSFRDSIYPGEPLPSRVDRNLGLLEVVVAKMMHVRITRLLRHLADRPSFGKYLTYEKGPGMVKIAFSKGLDLSKIVDSDRLFWCLHGLCCNPDAEHRYDYALVFAMLEEHLSKSSTVERARVDEKLYMGLSDYAATHELLTLIRLHRPRCQSYNITDFESDQQKRYLMLLAFETGKNYKIADIRLLGDFIKRLDRTRLATGRKDQDWLNTSKESRRVLSQFWDMFRRVQRKNLADLGWKQEEIDEEIGWISADLSPKHIQEVDGERASILKKLETASKPHPQVSKEEPQTQWDSLEDRVVKLEIQPKRDKVKTRPQLDPSLQFEPDNGDEDGEEAAAIAAPAIEASNPTIAVKKQTFALFSKMFPSADQEASSTSASWEELLAAMTSVGFLARHAGGSAVSFEREESATEGAAGRIVFHRPHPGNRINPVILRSMGKRITKWFGWDANTFVLREEDRKES